MWPDGTRKPNSVGGLSNQPPEVPRGLIGGDQRDQRTTPGEEFDVQCVFAKFFFFKWPFWVEKRGDPWKFGVFLVTWIFWVILKGHLEAGVFFFGSFWNTTTDDRLHKDDLCEFLFREFPNNSTGDDSLFKSWLLFHQTKVNHFLGKHTAFEMNSVSMNSESHVFVEFDVSMRTSPSNLNCIWIRSLPFVSLVEGVQHFAPSQWQSHDNAMWEPSAGYHHNAQHALAGSALKGSAVVHLWWLPPGVESVFSRGTGKQRKPRFRLLLLRIVPRHLKTMLCLLQMEITILYRRYIFKRSIFHCYVSLPECTTSEQSIWDSPF